MNTIRVAICLGFLLVLGLVQASAKTGTGASQVQSDCVQTAAADQPAQPAGAALPTTTPCGTNPPPTIYQNASTTHSVTITGQFINKCNGNISFTNLAGGAVGVMPIGPGQSQTITITVPPQDGIIMTCGGTKGNGCVNSLLNITVH